MIRAPIRRRPVHVGRGLVAHRVRPEVEVAPPVDVGQQREVELIVILPDQVQRAIDAGPMAVAHRAMLHIGAHTPGRLPVQRRRREIVPTRIAQLVQQLVPVPHEPLHRAVAQAGGAQRVGTAPHQHPPAQGVIPVLLVHPPAYLGNQDIVERVLIGLLHHEPVVGPVVTLTRAAVGALQLRIIIPVPLPLPPEVHVAAQVVLVVRGVGNPSCFC